MNVDPFLPATGSMPRVLLVCPVGDEIGGAEQVMLAIGRALPPLGFSPALVSMRPGRLAALARDQGTESFAFAETHRYRDVPSVFRAVQWLNGIARQTGAGLLHSTHTAHVYAGFTARRLKLPEVWHCHDAPSKARHDTVDFVQRRMGAAHTVFTTRHVAAGFPDIAGRPHSVIAPTCIDPQRLRRQPARDDVRRRLNIPPGEMLLTVARLQSHKGHVDLLDAAATVLKTRPDAVFVIVGRAGTVEQERYRAERVAQAGRLGIADRVVFTGFVDDADLAALYRGAAALVHPAWTEGYGLVLLEAMGMDVPVIAAAADGPAEIIRSGDNGLLVEPCAPAALAAAILCLLGDRPLRDRLCRGGAVTASQLTLGTMMKKVVAVYRQVLNPPRTTSERS